MKFKANVQNTAPMSPREEVEMKYKRSRANLLLVIIVSVVNLFTLALNGSYFLFSASIPAIPVELAMPMSEDEPLPEFGEIVAEGETPAEDGFNTFNEADFTYTADNTAPAEETAAEAETADEPVAARSFDEIMAENNEDGQ